MLIACARLARGVSCPVSAAWDNRRRSRSADCCLVLWLFNRRSANAEMDSESVPDLFEDPLLPNLSSSIPESKTPAACIGPEALYMASRPSRVPNADPCCKAGFPVYLECASGGCLLLAGLFILKSGDESRLVRLLNGRSADTARFKVGLVPWSVVDCWPSISMIKSFRGPWSHLEEVIECSRVPSGELGREIQTPSTSMPDSNALTPKGTSDPALRRSLICLCTACSILSFSEGVVDFQRAWPSFAQARHTVTTIAQPNTCQRDMLALPHSSSATARPIYSRILASARWAMI